MSVISQQSHKLGSDWDFPHACVERLGKDCPLKAEHPRIFY